jgi:hypothetical protein
MNNGSGAFPYYAAADPCFTNLNQSNFLQPSIHNHVLSLLTTTILIKTPNSSLHSILLISFF